MLHDHVIFIVVCLDVKAWDIINVIKAFYITHKNIPVILLVNTTSRDIKYYAYIPDIWREGKKLL